MVLQDGRNCQGAEIKMSFIDPVEFPEVSTLGFSEEARSHVRCALAVDKLFYISWCGTITRRAMHSKYCHHRCHQEHKDLLSSHHWNRD